MIIDEIVERLRYTGNNWYALAEIVWGESYDLRSIDRDLIESCIIRFCADEEVRVLDVPQISPATLRRIEALPTVGIFALIFPRL